MIGSRPKIRVAYDADKAAEEAASKNMFNSGRYRWLQAVNGDRTLTPNAHRVAVLLFSFFNSEKGYAWPSTSTMTEMLGINRSTVIRSIRQLERRKWISRTPSPRRGRSNEYRMLFGPDVGGIADATGG